MRLRWCEFHAVDFRLWLFIFAEPQPQSVIRAASWYFSGLTSSFSPHASGVNLGQYLLPTGACEMLYRNSSRRKTMGCAENDAVLKISQTQTESVRFNAVLAADVNTRYQI